MTPGAEATFPPLWGADPGQPLPKPAEARAWQHHWARQVELASLPGPVRRVAGVDVGFRDRGRLTVAAVVVLSYPALEPLEAARAECPTRMPYIPGLLSFREVPAAMLALRQLRQQPDVLLCDGQGIAHPRRFGLACHLGLLAGLPAVGVAKSRLTGHHEPLPEERGAWCPLREGEEILGAVLRSRTGVRPIFVSPGHRITLTQALQLVMGCVTRFRLPETTRCAHRLASGPFPLPEALTRVLSKNSEPG